jgi:hypothetical protein
MSLETGKKYVKPEDVPKGDAERVLNFLNEAKTAEEIANTVTFPGAKNVGIRACQSILSERGKLGEFKNLEQVACVPRLGSVRFTHIVTVFGERGTPSLISEQIVWPFLAQNDPVCQKISFTESCSWASCTDLVIDGPLSYDGDGHVDERTKSKLKLRWKQKVPKKYDPGPKKDGKIDVTIEVEDKGGGKARVKITNNENNKILTDDPNATITQNNKRITVTSKDKNGKKHTVEFEPENGDEIDVDIDGWDYDLEKKKKK